MSGDRIGGTVVAAGAETAKHVESLRFPPQVNDGQWERFGRYEWTVLYDFT